MLALAAAGTVAMATLQVLKEITPLRGAYQRRWFERWVDKQAADAAILQWCESNAYLIAHDAEQQIVELAAGGARDALYDLSVEDMIVQMNAAAPIVIDEAHRYEALLLVLALGIEKSDFDALVAGQPKNQPTNDYFEVRARATRRIQRNLSGVEFALGAKWKFWMQVTSLVLTTMIIEFAMASSELFTVSTALLAIPVGIVGGYLAPIARDLVAALQKLRE